MVISLSEVSIQGPMLSKQHNGHYRTLHNVVGYNLIRRLKMVSLEKEIRHLVSFVKPRSLTQNRFLMWWIVIERCNSMKNSLVVQ